MFTAPPPARQSIVIDFVTVGDPKNPKSTQEIMSPSSALEIAPSIERHAIVGVKQLLPLLPLLDMYKNCALAFDAPWVANSAVVRITATKVSKRFMAFPCGLPFE